MRLQGKLTSWNDAKGFGFIAWHEGGEPVFVHVSAFVPGRRRPVGNESVTYELQMDDRGRPRAGNVAFASGRQVGAGTPAMSFSAGFTALFLLVLCISVWAGTLPPAVLALYCGASVLTFAAYWKDKAAARNNSWRTPESTLQLFGLIGGWPGALLAQRIFRHKCGKQSFQVTFRATVILNCGALLMYAIPAASRLLRLMLT
jgi:uncharacterized membrane protein YsdA (DUF1294 family)/cold shock CspA family protein